MASIIKKIISLAAVSLTLSSAASAESYRYSHFFPEPFPLNKAEKFFVEEMKKRTDGEIDIEITYGSALGGQKEILDFVGAGIVEIASVPSSFYISQVPAMEIFAMSLLWDSPKQVAEMYRETITTVPEAKAGYDAMGVTPFLFRGLDPYVMLCNTPVRTLDDLQGIKVRTFGSVLPKIFAELGAIPVDTTTSEIYEAAQRGTVDCVYFSRVAHMIFKIYEVTKYEIDFEFGAVGGYLSYINSDVLNSWTEEQQATFWEVASEAEVVANQALDATYGKAREVFDAKLEKIEFTDGDKIREAFPADRMIGMYVETVSEIGETQAAVGEVVAEHVRNRLGISQ